LGSSARRGVGHWRSVRSALEIVEYANRSVGVLRPSGGLPNAFGATFPASAPCNWCSANWPKTLNEVVLDDMAWAEAVSEAIDRDPTVMLAF
jgi:hypothetical protein